ncbi:thioesterase family protein [uncultured Pseudoteredinibacter sp.]|uniref:thioesterase family protein n=1 Tax=uncultured Pseudoteredinibacter sp. TaxID=1641701 RepID=UPI00261EABCF|nr:thioesterase family protein [uncultured Pseudoteredinibacter sp.]
MSSYSPTLYEFDRDTELTLIEQQLNRRIYSLEVSDRWSFGNAPNGGYMAALLAKAGRLALPDHPDPISATTQFIQPAKPARAEIEVRLLRVGGRLSQTTIELQQDGQICAQATVVFSNLGKLKGVSHFQGDRPSLPALESCQAVTGANASFRDRVDARFFPDCAPFWPGGGSDAMSNAGWIQMADGRPNDALSLLVFADAFPRAVAMRSGKVGWIPTVDMTVQILQAPAEGHVACLFNTRKIHGGILEEQGELWDSEGNLVALCRQSAVPRIPQEAALWADDAADLAASSASKTY